ncbi:hypothetical protein M9979_13960 [Sphingomonas sp. RP10(2022)]|uniref:Uncharacterized protein n=1 Tax=Sphingomonas liriopis TaxID=2949094 RepID=A0A9X2HUW2_9SPHN|nr:hypothetical protein [Sphingomonas liriopis]MCP3735974.1 hypothetical protein [Sphingomonas liriopis]
MSFATTFTFARPNAAPYRAADGRMAIAAIDAPRLDHRPDGSPIGLLVEAGSEMGQHDAIRLRDGMISLDGGEKATVLHEVAGADGAIVRRAHYTRAAQATVNACLAQLGRHRLIAVVPGFLPIRSSTVAYRGRRWTPPAIVTLADGTPISLRVGLQLLAS